MENGPPHPPHLDGLIELGEHVVTAGFAVAGWTERQVLGLLKSRLDSLSPKADQATPSPPGRPSLTSRMSGLLERALEQSPDAGREELFRQILDRLVPDEARILGALSDGSRSPLVHIQARSRAGALGDLLVENASLIGRTANVTVPRLTPRYLAQLLSLGLVETGPEDPKLKDDYQILLADPDVLRVLRTARGPIPPRVERLTVGLSALGRELWAECFPDDHPVP